MASTFIVEKINKDTRTHTESIIRLVDLPVEILEQILLDPSLPDELLYKISLLSRRLHYIFLPIFLLRHGIENCKDITLNFRRSKPRIDALSGLRIALFLSSVKRISCAIFHPGIDILSTVTIFDRLTLFFQRLDTVEEVSLVLKTAVYNQAQADVISQPSHVDVQDGLSLFSLSFGRLLNALLNKACTKVTLGGAPGLSMPLYCFWYKVAKPSSRPWTAKLKALIDRRRRESDDDSDHGHPYLRYLKAVGDELSLSSSKLTTLTISACPNLLIRPFSICLLSILQLPSITSLKICDISVADDIWVTILPHIANAAPGLQELTISNCIRIFTSNIFQLLAGFSSLKKLTLGKFIQIEDELLRSPHRPRPHLSLFNNLENLRVPYDWLFELIFTPYEMPQLKQLTIYSCLGYAGLHTVITYDVATILVRSIIQRLLDLQWFPEINLTVPIGLQFCPLTLGFGASHANLSNPIIPAQEQLAIFVWVNTFPASAAILNVIHSLTIQIDDAQKIGSADNLAQWMALFPCLRQITVKAKGGSAALVSLLNEALKTSKLGGRLGEAEMVIFTHAAPSPGDN
ncbi:hypothetical protein BDQ17DRAFT_1345868, partial [Cyathus striatus]